jgi:hypothetical protein
MSAQSMSQDDLESILRARMKAHAAELDRSLRPAPRLAAVLISGRAAGRRLGRMALGLALGFAAAAVLLVAVLSGALMLRLPATAPLASIAPSLPSIASPSPTLSSPPSRASPTPAPSLAFLLERPVS